MSAFMSEGGPFMYLILILGVVALMLTLYRSARLLQGTAVSAASVNTVLYLGCAALLLGVTAQLTGLYMAASAIIRAENIAPPIIARGILVSFNTTLFGLYVFVIALLLWLALRALASRRSPANA